VLNQVDSKYLMVKIDGWFSSAIADKPTQLVMCEFVDILHRLGVEVIAECIETETQLNTWTELGVDYGQGWLWR
jgi:EAL domain-containing protein (putative c-di-GMP-specific phosphodiesterase class I)